MRHMLVIVLACALVLIGWSASSAEISLQQLIDQTEVNGTLQLEGKTYHGNIIITKPITIRGTEKTVIRGDGTANVITVKASYVTLDQLRIQHSGKSRNSDEEFSGVRVLEQEYNQFLNLEITDTFHGIYLTRSDNNLIQNVTVTGLGQGKLGSQGNGIQVVRSFDNKIENNRISKTRDGIYFEYADRNEIVRNVVTETRYGLHYMYSNNNIFLENQFLRNIGGAAIMSSMGIRLEGNQFSFNKGDRSFGLIIQTSRDNVVINNQFVLNQRGIFFDQATNNRVENNQFIQNDIGVEIWATASDQVFVGNTFSKNRTTVLAVGGENRNRWEENGQGNYWDKSLLTFDLDQDGVGDDPIQYKSALHKLIAANELTYLFLKSPAILMYEKMNALVQQQDIMAMDNYPMIEQKRASLAWVLVPFVLIFATYYGLRRRWER